MGRYTSRVRTGGSVTVGNPETDQPTKAEYVYSWRSGKSADLPDSSHEAPNALFGIRPPRKKGSVLELVQDRSRFVSELSETVSNYDEVEGPPTVCSATDIGHRFRSLKVHNDKVGSVVMTGLDGDVRKYPTVAIPWGFVPQNWGMTYDQFPASSSIASAYNGYAPDMPLWSQGTIQAKLNAKFADMAPNGRRAGVGETIISLIQGDFPRLLKNYVKLLNKTKLKVRDVGKLGGEEYLNASFGWKPLVDDLMNVIDVLMKIDHLVYGEASRRSRVIRQPPQFATFKSNYAAARSAYTKRHWGDPLFSGYGDDAFEYQISVNSDTRLTARFGALARPGIGANSFPEKAKDTLLALGVWYPSLGWDLFAYSWLVDWFIHLGAAIDNASYYGNQLGQVPIDYAWATTAVRVSVQGTPSRAQRQDSYWRFSFGGSFHGSSVAKVRLPATPFGFGLDLSGLSSGQIAILVALGLARIR